MSGERSPEPDGKLKVERPKRKAVSKSEVGSQKSEVKLKADKKSKVVSPKSVRKDSFGEEENTFAIDIPYSEIDKQSEIENPTSEIIEPLTTHNSQLTTMEVHHHPDLHHQPKPWKEYFLEFLMIFLAVTMGFFAETIREDISENGKATELAKSLYQEVYADSVNMQYRLSLRIEKEHQMNYFRKFMKDSSLMHLSDKFYPSFFWTFAVSSVIQFTPNNGILDQLRNSGSLRYFKSTELQNSISRINVVILNLRDRNSQEDAFVENFSRPFMQRYYDFDWEDELTQYGKISGIQAILQDPVFHTARMPQIRNINNFDREDAEALATHYMLLARMTKLLFYDPYIQANHQLLQILREQYNLKND
ncbi:MAG TPA: hypothetical protein VIJ27_10580 [Mucilaginibacter sp.]